MQRFQEQHVEDINSSFPNSVMIWGTFKQHTIGKILNKNPTAKLQEVLEEKKDLLTSKGCLL